MSAATAYVVGKYLGAAVACFGGPAVGAAVGRQFANRWRGLVFGTLAGGSVYLTPYLLLMLV